MKWQTLNHTSSGTRKLCWESDRQQKKSSIEDLKRCAIKWINQCSESFNVRGKHATDETWEILGSHQFNGIANISSQKHTHNSLYNTIENVYQLFVVVVVVVFSWAWNSYTHTCTHEYVRTRTHTHKTQTNEQQQKLARYHVCQIIIKQYCINWNHRVFESCVWTIHLLHTHTRAQQYTLFLSPCSGLCFCSTKFLMWMVRCLRLTC